MGRTKPLQETHPDLLAEWDYENNVVAPSEVSRGSSTKAWWKCGIGHRYSASVQKRVAGQGCPVCAGKSVVPGFNDLASQYPKLAEEWDSDSNELRADEVTPSSGLKRWWICPGGHSYEARPAHRIRGVGCPYCANKRLLPGFNDLRTRSPLLAAEWDMTRNERGPEEQVATSAISVYWLCSQGHSYRSSLRNRVRLGTGCPICVGQRTLPGFNDLVTRHPDVAAEWHPERNALEPVEVAAATGRKVWWLCPEGHDYQASVSSRTRSGSGCPFCSGRVAIRGTNDLKTVNPELASEWSDANDRSPSEVKAMSDYRAWWRCSSGHEWRATVSSRHHVAAGCPSCATYGFDPNRPGVLYLLRNESLGALKLGITNVGTTRLLQFAELGWIALRTWKGSDGAAIRAVEQRLLYWLRKDMGAPIKARPEELPIGGFTETFPLGFLPIREIIERIEIELDRSRFGGL